jgi:hypothetical protein
MNDELYTSTGSRPDLAALEVNPPEGYIGSKLLPNVPVTEKTQTIYYATVKADAAAQTNRSQGSGPTGVQISPSSTTFTAAEACKRGLISPDEVKLYGGIEKADRIGAAWAKRQVMNARETAIATDTLGKTPAATFDPAKFFEVCQTAIQTVRLYEGRLVLYGATMSLRKVVQSILANSTFGPVLARTITGTAPAVAATGFNFQAWMAALAMLAGVDEVLAGDDAVWNATAVAGRVGIAKIDDGADPLSHKWKPVLGKVFQFLPNGTDPWQITSVADRVNINNIYDAFAWYDSVILNTAANYVVDGVNG